MSEWDRGELLARLAAALPDAPRWLETRSMLLDGSAEVLGLNDPDSLDFIVRDPESQLVSVVGRPSPDAFREALYRNEGRGVFLAQLSDAAYAAAHLPGWRKEIATIHLLLGDGCLPPVASDEVRIVTLPEIVANDDIPNELKDEMRSAASHAEIAAALKDGRPVAFCYAASDTESLWDISIDTLEPYRRLGHAQKVVCFMIDRMAEKGKRPVWGAEESNTASMALAAKLGFRPVERLVVFHAPGE